MKLDQELLDMIANASPLQLWKAEQVALVNIAAGVDVEETGEYYDAIKAAQAKHVEGEQR